MEKSEKIAKELSEIIEDAPKKARKIAFKNEVPVAFIKDGKIVLEYKDKSTKVISKNEILKEEF